MAAVDYFLKIDGVEGESTDDKHKGEIDVLSWSWGVTQSGTMAHGGGGGEGKASFHDFNFTHNIDKASPVLMKSCASGEHIKDAVLTARKSGERQEEFLKVTFSDILVSSFLDSGGQDGVNNRASLSYLKVTERVGQPITIDIDARAAGTAQLDVRTGAIEILSCPEGQCTLVAGFYQQFLARGLAEFEFKDVLPLINPPLGNGRLSFQCIPVQQPPTDVIGVPALDSRAFRRARLPASGPRGHSRRLPRPREEGRDDTCWTRCAGGAADRRPLGDGRHRRRHTRYSHPAPWRGRAHGGRGGDTASAESDRRRVHGDPHFRVELAPSRWGRESAPIHLAIEVHRDGASRLRPQDRRD